MTDSIEVLITLPFSEELIAQLIAVSPRLQITTHIASKPEEIPDEIWKEVEVLYTNRVLPELDKVPRLTWIQFHWAGVDHALEAPLLHRPDLVATHLSGASATQMAEHAILMILALGHQLPEAVNYQKRAEWPKGRWEIFSPQELRGSTVGIVGYGSIGRETARLLIGFGATVLATKRDAMHPEDRGYIPEGIGDPGGELVHRLYPPQALHSMLKICDFVIITVPLTQHTRGLIGPEELAVLKPSAFLIDISRGGVIDHNALITCLREYKIAGAALDVYPVEPLPADSPLWKLPNVLLTPHIGGFSRHYDARAVNLFAENLRRYLAGMPLYNRIQLEWGY